MNIQDAIQQARQRQPYWLIRRTSWKEADYLRLRDKVGLAGNDIFCHITGDMTLAPWMPSQSDLMADDWEIIPEPPG